MKQCLYVAILLWAGLAQAYVLSPTSIEVKFSYTAEFQTSAAKRAALDIATDHSSFLFGYMQSPELAAQYDINHRTAGFGAPAWPPAITILNESTVKGLRTIQYHAEGVLLVSKLAAPKMVGDGQWVIALPYDLDNYYNKKCVTPGEGTGKTEFWYFYDPYMPNCENLVTSPLAQIVTVKIGAMPAVDENETMDLSSLRGDNGNGTLFQITTITGFNDSEKKSDDGAVSYKVINDWLATQGFTQTVIQAYKDRPINQFDKDVVTPDGRTVHVRITLLIAETDLDTERVTFDKFLKASIQVADVIIYAGHSGAGTMLEASDIEHLAGPLEFDVNKKQLFFFDACSGYSYYMPLFEGRKTPGTLDMLTMALTSQFLS